MNSWISSELEKIDIKTEKFLQEFKRIKSNVSPKLFKMIYQPIVDKLNNCYEINGNLNIHNVHDECQQILECYYEYELEIN
jgi:thymidylate kinase